MLPAKQTGVGPLLLQRMEERGEERRFV